MAIVTRLIIICVSDKSASQLQRTTCATMSMARVKTALCTWSQEKPLTHTHTSAGVHSSHFTRSTTPCVAVHRSFMHPTATEPICSTLRATSAPSVLLQPRLAVCLARSFVRWAIQTDVETREAQIRGAAAQVDGSRRGLALRPRAKALSAGLWQGYCDLPPLEGQACGHVNPRYAATCRRRRRRHRGRCCRCGRRHLHAQALDAAGGRVALREGATTTDSRNGRRRRFAGRPRHCCYWGIIWDWTGDCLVLRK